MTNDELPRLVRDALTASIHRLDREYTYIGMLVYLWLAALGIYFLPIGTGAVATLDPQTQKLLATAIFVGVNLCLMGSAMGPGPQLTVTRPVVWFLKRKLLRRILGHPYAPLALRHCYRLDVAGQFSCCISLFFFTTTLLSTGSIVGSLTGLMPPILLVCWLRKAHRLRNEYRIMDAEYHRLAQNINGLADNEG